ncbi:hypothetical protein [Planotetraspora kaengkrachanensis]|uniref:DUF4760 domain-containing protein n=1 Tax=Planotetraspora kaengkrachanensis TaxID=575193 RepID=A0A8J3PQE7_9ACTN|nr:hypothetical protein [Planotetraspora kaengkrachanensis]GIG77344.1 hypothetical protein Pka01_04710 [Planotetraspora kaengkrachanensis]
MNDTVSISLTVAALVVAMVSAFIAWSSARTARASSRPGHIQNLFLANQAALDHPELWIDVHGIPAGTSERDARALVYLSILLDGYLVAHNLHVRGDFDRMLRYMKRDGDSLCRMLAIPENVARWEIVKKHSYGDFEPGFVAAVDALIAHEQAKRSDLPASP